MGADVVSWVALAGGAVFGVLSARSWKQTVRYWGNSAAHPKPSPLARFVGPEGRRRLADGSILDSVCKSGIAILLLGGTWLPSGGSADARNPVAFSVAAIGLAIFVVGLLGQISLVVVGRPLFVMPKHARGHSARTARRYGRGAAERVAADGSSVTSPSSPDEPAEVLVFRDKDDSYAHLRHYKVYLDGEHVASLRRGEGRVTAVVPGGHTVQVRISWCSSPVVRVDVAPGDKPRLICRAAPGVESDPTAIFKRRHEFLLLHAV